MKHVPFISCQIGDFLVTALSDGNISASLDLLSGIETVDAEVIQHNAGIVEPGNIHINCYLIRGRGRTILVDTGTGGQSEAGGQLKANLVAAGVRPDDVDTVLLTHGHPDHIGGCWMLKGDQSMNMLNFIFILSKRNTGGTMKNREWPVSEENIISCWLVAH